MAAMDQLVGLTQVIQAIQGQESQTEQKTKGTKTTQTNVSDAGVNQLIQNILRGPGGVRSIGNAARQSGLYNSTTEDQLLGDLYSRAAVQAELARSPTTVTEDTTTTGTVTQGGTGAGPIAGLIGMGLLNKGLGSLMGGGGGEGGLMSTIMGGGNTAAPTTGAVATPGAAVSTSSVSGGGGILDSIMGGSDGGGLGGIISSIFGGSSGAATGATIGSAATSVGPEVAKMPGLFSSGGGSILGAGAESGAATAASSSVMGGFANAVPYVGSFLGGILGGADGESTDQDKIGATVSGAVSGAMVGGPWGAVIGGLAGLAGSFLGDSSVICTALLRKGLISKEAHKAGERYFANVPLVTKVGYWAWGEAVAKSINGGNRFWAWLVRPVVDDYLNYLRTRDCFYYPVGAVAHYLGEPVCHVIGRLVIYWQINLKRA